MDLSDLKELTEYHAWANDRILQAVEALSPDAYNRDLGSSFPSIAATLAHLMTAEAIWMGRWLGVSIPTVRLEEIPTPAAARERWSALQERLRRFVDGLGPEKLQAVTQVRTSQGREFRHSLHEMLLHLLNHGTYHRGQVVTMLRQAGADAPSTDLIQFYRWRSGQL